MSAVPDPTVEALLLLNAASEACVQVGLSPRWGEQLAPVLAETLAPLLTARVAAPDALRTKLEAALADSRNQWWHTGGTPCVPRRVIRALLED